MLTAPFPPIDTARLHLRCVAPPDAAATSTLMTQAISRWLASWPFPFSLERAQRRIELAQESANHRDTLPYAITAKDDGTLMGWITLNRNLDDKRRGTVGYWLGEQFHGQGYAREALAALLQEGFDLLNLNVIEAGAQPENTGSLAVMRACGMVETGERVVHATSRGRDERCVFYEMNRVVS